MSAAQGVAYSDHGDWAGDVGLVEKWPSALDDCLARVPLIIRAPGSRAGHVVREPVEAFDLMATVLELAGIPARHTHFARSLVPPTVGLSTAAMAFANSMTWPPIRANSATSTPTRPVSTCNSQRSRQTSKQVTGWRSGSLGLRVERCALKVERFRMRGRGGTTTASRMPAGPVTAGALLNPEA